MRYTICFDEHKECFLAEKVKTSKNPMLFKTKRIAKKYPEKFQGVCTLDTPEKIEKALLWLEIGDVWGIGRRLGNKMKDAGVYKAADLLKKPEIWVRKLMGNSRREND